jgi:hypothetical protein
MNPFSSPPPLSARDFVDLLTAILAGVFNALAARKVARAVRQQSESERVDHFEDLPASRAASSARAPLSVPDIPR